MSKRVSLSLASFVVAMLAIGSVAYACTTMQGQTFIDSKPRKPVAGSSITAHATGLKMLDPNAGSPGVDAIWGTADDTADNPQYFLMQDPWGTYCHPEAAKISVDGGGNLVGLGWGTTEPWDTGTITGKISGNVPKGETKFCVSTGYYAAWPYTMTVY